MGNHIKKTLRLKKKQGQALKQKQRASTQTKTGAGNQKKKTALFLFDCLPAVFFEAKHVFSTCTLTDSSREGPPRDESVHGFPFPSWSSVLFVNVGLGRQRRLCSLYIIKAPLCENDRGLRTAASYLV